MGLCPYELTISLVGRGLVSRRNIAHFADIAGAYGMRLYGLKFLVGDDVLGVPKYPSFHRYRGRFMNRPYR